jgi:hypothetical protein
MATVLMQDLIIQVELLLARRALFLWATATTTAFVNSRAFHALHLTTAYLEHLLSARLDHFVLLTLSALHLVLQVLTLPLLVQPLTLRVTLVWLVHGVRVAHHRVTFVLPVLIHTTAHHLALPVVLLHHVPM